MSVIFFLGDAACVAAPRELAIDTLRGENGSAD